MRRIFSMFVVSLVAIGGMFGSASAMPNAVTITVFDDAFTLTGQNRTLVLVFGPAGQATFSMEVNTVDIGDVTVFLDDAKVEVTAGQELLGIAVLGKGMPLSQSSLDFTDILATESLLIADFNFRRELLVVKRTITATESEYWTVDIHTPEPSTLLLLGGGVIGLLGLGRWRRRRK